MPHLDRLDSWELVKCPKCQEYTWEGDITVGMVCNGKAMQDTLYHNGCGGRETAHLYLTMCSKCWKSNYGVPSKADRRENW